MQLYRCDTTFIWKLSINISLEWQLYKPLDISSSSAPSNKPYKYKIAIDNRSGAKVRPTLTNWTTALKGLTTPNFTLLDHRQDWGCLFCDFVCHGCFFSYRKSFTLWLRLPISCTSFPRYKYTHNIGLGFGCSEERMTIVLSSSRFSSFPPLYPIYFYYSNDSLHDLFLLF